MNFNEYQNLAQRTANKNAYDIEKIMNGCLGLAGESGECCDILKKNMFGIVRSWQADSELRLEKWQNVTF